MIMMDLNSNFYGKLSLDYYDNVPENYDVSQMQFTYDFIYMVLKGNESIDSAIKGVSDKYKLSESYLNDYLLENKYVLKKTNHEETLRQLKMHNTKALKKILKSHGLKASGKIKKIEQRILEHDLLGSNCRLSSKSRVFYKNKKRRMAIFDQYLSGNYYFCEFNEYYMGNFRKKEENIPIEFINRHIGRAIENENHSMFVLNNHIMTEHFLEKQNYKRMLEHVLNVFCINMNPVWKIDELKSHEGISAKTYDYLLFLIEKIGKNRIISAYFVVWDSFNFEKVIVSKYAGYKYLKKILNSHDRISINRDLERNFYSRDDLRIKTVTQKTLFDF